MKKIGILIVVITVLVFSSIILRRYSGSETGIDSQQPLNQETKQFLSRYLGFTVVVPSGFATEEGQTYVEFAQNSDNISVVRNGTNFSNLDEYISNFDSRRELTFSNSKKTTIDGYEAVSRIVTFPSENITQKSYYIYANGVVYIFSTSSESLYDELDQIAQSFRYTP